jgi:hypothetical protein
MAGQRRCRRDFEQNHDSRAVPWQAPERDRRHHGRRKERRRLLMESNGAMQVIKTADSVRETINEDGAVLLDIKQGLCFSMNPVGAKIWEMLKKQYPPNQIAAALELEFQLPRAQIEQDIAEFLEHLKTRNLIRTGDERSTEKRSWISRLLLRRSFS